MRRRVGLSFRLLAMIGLAAYVDCRGNLSFRLRDHFLAAFECLFSAIPQLPSFVAGVFIPFSSFLCYVFPGFVAGFRGKIECRPPIRYPTPPGNSLLWELYF